MTFTLTNLALYFAIIAPSVSFMFFIMKMHIGQQTISDKLERVTITLDLLDARLRADSQDLAFLKGRLENVSVSASPTTKSKSKSKSIPVKPNQISTELTEELLKCFKEQAPTVIPNRNTT